MSDPDDLRNELNGLVQRGASVYVGAIHTVLGWLVSAIIYWIVMGQFEVYFYGAPLVAVVLWLYTCYRLQEAYFRGEL